MAFENGLCRAPERGGKAAKKRHTTAFQGVGADGRKASRRPRGTGSRAVRLNLALSEEEVALYRVRARDAGMSLSYWLVSAANAYAGVAPSKTATSGDDASASPVLAEDVSCQIYLTDAEIPQTPSAPAKQARHRARERFKCALCGRAFELDWEGKLTSHRREDPDTGALVHCPGSKQSPESLSTAFALAARRAAGPGRWARGSSPKESRPAD